MHTYSYPTHGSRWDYYAFDLNSANEFVIHGGRIGFSFEFAHLKGSEGINRIHVQTFGGKAGGSRVKRLFLPWWRRSYLE